MSSTLRIFDSLSRSLVEFHPREPGKVSIYACGLTPQAPAHIGHMRGAVFFDVVIKWLTHLGYVVDFVQNFTDIDDKIIRRSAEERISPAEVAAKYGQMYLEDLKALNVKPARFVYVTEHMGEIIAMIQKIMQNGFAYEVDGDIYFRVSHVPDYGKLSNRDLESMQAGARIEVDDRKEHPMDFALWKSAKPGEPSWDSPWGKGRPGWHIECSALSLHELGPNFDIHAGGVDLVFPHHENEIAQSEAYLGKPEFARIWMHWGAVRLDKEKMSKSIGNVFGVRDVLEKYSAGALRMLFFGTRYRSPIDYQEDRMQEAQNSYLRILTTLARVKQIIGPVEPGEPDAATASQVADAMNSDFNTPAALAVLHGTLGELNEIVADGLAGNSERAAELYRSAVWISDLLGLPLEEQKRSTEQMDVLMQKVIEWRKLLRAEKQYAIADRIRDDLKQMNITLEDSVEGTTWRVG